MKTAWVTTTLVLLPLCGSACFPSALECGAEEPCPLSDDPCVENICEQGACIEHAVTSACEPSDTSGGGDTADTTQPDGADVGADASTTLAPDSDVATDVALDADACVCEPPASVCAEAVCDDAAACVLVPSGASGCDDGDDCTVEDACDGTACAGTPVVCEPRVCHEAGVCQAGTCTYIPLGDGTPCEAPRGPGACEGGHCFDVPVVVAGAEHTCAIRGDQTLWCWGANARGQLGLGTSTDVGDGVGDSVSKAGFVLGGVVSVGLGYSASAPFTCASREAPGAGGGVKGLRCWGANDGGYLGYFDTLERGSTPSTRAAVLPELTLSTSPFDVAAVSLGVYFGCAQSDSGLVRCWGDSGTQFTGVNPGVLGYPGVIVINTPGGTASTDLDAIKLDNEGRASVDLSVGSRMVCVRLNDGNVRCWGTANYVGTARAATAHIGDDEHPNTHAFVNTDWLAVDIDAGDRHTCAVSDEGDVWCWGDNDAGQLGTLSTTVQRTPVQKVAVGTQARALQVAAGATHTCARFEGGAVRCWGNGADGRLGYGSEASIGDAQIRPIVADVPLGLPAVGISAGAAHTCAVLESGAVVCWGLGANGRLGNDSTDSVGDAPEEMPPVPVDFGTSR